MFFASGLWYIQNLNFLVDHTAEEWLQFLKFTNDYLQVEMVIFGLFSFKFWGACRLGKLPFHIGKMI